MHKLSLGLLVSIALRNNHAFGCPQAMTIDSKGDLDFYPEPEHAFYDRQNRELVEAFKLYIKVKDGVIEDNSDFNHAKEEITGRGFYIPGREDYYINFLAKKPE